MSGSAGENEPRDPHESPTEPEQPAKGQGPEHTSSHAGNGTVNHGPDGQGADARGPEGLEPDEQTLRMLLHSAVEDIEPSRGTLEHLRRAVPARRARKRQAAVGMAAACLFVGTAVPALLHVSRAGGTDPNTSIAGQASAAQGGAGQGKGPDGGSSGAGQSGGKESGRGKDSGKGSDQGRSAGAGSGASAGTGPSASAGTSAAVCTPEQLGKALGTVNAPDASGIVYGTFQVGNVSSTGCTVDGAGTVSALAQGTADATRISTVRHTAGDAAAGLPDPSLEVTSVTLLPGASYTEKFAFVPSQSCPTGSDNGGTGTGGPTSDPSPSQDPGTGSGATDTGGTSGASTQLLTEEGTGDGSVQVSHVPQAGGPVGVTVVPNACAGTLYWTGMLASS